MATYKEIKGVTIQTLDTDPVEGGIGGGSWSSGGDLNTARKGSMGFGVLTANIVAGGNNPGGGTTWGVVEQYNGTAWTEITDLNTARRSGKAVGSTTAGLVVAGVGAPPSREAKETESWNGSAWTEVGDITRPASTQSFGSAGASNTSAMIFGGEPGTTYFTYTETWDGSSWTEVNNLNTGRQSPAGFGIVTAAICAGGYSPPAPPGNVVASNESWDGTNWTEVNDLNTARGQQGGSGAFTDGLIYGGGAPPGSQAVTEAWDGTSYTEVSDMATARSEFGYAPNGASPQSSQAAIVAGGNTPGGNVATTEEWTTAGPTSTILVEGDAFLGGGTTFKGVVKASSPATTWSSGGNTNTDRAYGHCFGPQTAAQMAAGEAPPRVTVSEQYDGTSWTEVNDTNHAGGVQARAGSGTQTAATIAAFAGASVPYGHAETWNGTSWSDTSELNTTKYSRASTLTSGPAALVFGGTNPGVTANTESFDGTSWTEVNNLNATKYAGSGVGSPTAGMSIGGYEPGGYTVNVESWNGTSWSEGTNTNAAQGYGGAAGASSSNAVKFGGSGGPTGYSAITELWNGSSWTEIGNLSTSYAGNIGTGSSAAALNIPGKSAPSTYPGACEEFTGDITLQTITVS